MNRYPKAKLLLSGGKKYSDDRSLEISEAAAMEQYIVETLGQSGYERRYHRDRFCER